MKNYKVTYLCGRDTVFWYAPAASKLDAEQQFRQWAEQQPNPVRFITANLDTDLNEGTPVAE